MNIKVVAKANRVLFNKGDFSIVSFLPQQTLEGSVDIDPQWGTFTAKGTFPPFKDGDVLQLTLEEEYSEKYGKGYKLIYCKLDLDLTTEEGVKDFLSAFLTAKQVEALCDSFDNPLEVIKEQDIDKLVSVKGIGKKTAERIINNYLSIQDYEPAFIHLAKYGISSNTIKKACDYYKSAELCIQKVEENPYELMKLDNIGFKKADAIFMQVNGDVNSPIRLKAFLTHTLQENANNGHTWIALVDLFEAVKEYIPNADAKLIGGILKSNEEFFIAEGNKISLTAFVKLEALVAKELTRILQAENKFEYEGWEEDVAKTEENQGWSFTEQQKGAMKVMFDNNVSIILGYGGTGKSTSLKAVLDVLESKGYTYAQSALSGKASNNLALITGRDGYTIHRLLGFNPEEGGFTYNAKNPLPYDVIVIDEISMVDQKLFAHLLLAIRSGAKLIMLGDDGQLEAIGIPVLKPMLDSGLIPRIMLTQIHRQAQKSAIITHSIAVRGGKNSMKPDLGKQIHGELQDLEYNNVGDEEHIFMYAIAEFNKYIQTHEIKDIQILSATRSKGKASCYELNSECQRIYNPASPNKQEAQIGKEETGYVLREGDKVINIQNNYNATDEFDKTTAVFNGNMGIIECFDEDDDGRFILIDFEGIGRIKIHEGKWSTIELGYAITTHKAQGASIPVTIVAFPFHYLLGTRQFLYTAMTRAREKCVIITSKKTVGSAIKKNEVSKKRTYLAQFLKETVK